MHRLSVPRIQQEYTHGYLVAFAWFCSGLAVQHLAHMLRCEKQCTIPQNLWQVVASACADALIAFTRSHSPFPRQLSESVILFPLFPTCGSTTDGCKFVAGVGHFCAWSN
jgi:hypothetical protein